MKYLILALALTGCAYEPPLHRVKPQDAVTIEWATKQVCYANGVAQTAKECAR